MLERLRTGRERTQSIEMGIATEKDMDVMLEDWGKWMDADDATLGIVNGQAIVNTK